MKNRFGIDWDDIIRREFVTRMAAAPYMEEAGSLLMSAASLWQGPLGFGRVRAKELRQFGYELSERGRNWRQSALGWSPPPEWDSCYRQLLAEHRDRRTHHPAAEAPKNARAALRLTDAAIRLVIDQLQVVGATGDHLHRREAVEKIEDLLEALGEHPAARPDGFQMAFMTLRHLALRAAYRTCEGLYASVASIWCCSKRDRTADEKREMDRWYAAAKTLNANAARCYERFAANFVKDEEAALLASRDDADAYCYPHCDGHYAGPDDIRIAGQLAQGLSAAILGLAFERYGGGEKPDAVPVVIGASPLALPGKKD